MAARFPSNLVWSIVGSVAVHALFVVGQARASRKPETPAALTTEVDLSIPEEKKEPPVVKEPETPVEEEKKEEPKPVVEPSRARQPQAPSVAPSPAAAGKTLTAPETAAAAQQPADFSLVQGEGLSYAGGTTASFGTSTSAVHGPASAAGSPGAAASAPVAAVKRAPTADQSRAARPVSLNWDCSRLYPSDPEAGNDAAVVIVVTVRPDGTAQSVAVARDPGHGFGGAARVCALSQRYTPGLDQAGQPTTSATAPITVRFSR